jgi:phosphoglycerol transferase MdoB-like AlkP superfamily enzyme
VNRFTHLTKALSRDALTTLAWVAVLDALVLMAVFNFCAARQSEVEWLPYLHWILKHYFAPTMAIGFLLGAVIFSRGPRPIATGRMLRHAFAVVVMSWAVVAVIACLIFDLYIGAENGFLRFLIGPGLWIANWLMRIRFVVLKARDDTGEGDVFSGA